MSEDKSIKKYTAQRGILNTWQKYVEELYETRNRPAILDIENETDISEDGKGFPILMVEVELAIKEIKNRKATGVDGIPIALFKCMGEGKKEILSLCNKIYNEGEWPEELMETVLLPIPKKQKCGEMQGVQDYHPDITHCKDSPENIKSTDTF